MKTIKINLYQFEELGEQAKEKAVEKLYDINVNHVWWDFVYDDAKTIGCKIEGFDLGRAMSIDFKMLENSHDHIDVANAIIQHHGQMCDTNKLASEFLDEIQQVEGDELEKVYDQFIDNLAFLFWEWLRNEFEYLTSDKAIIETIESNEYWFTEDGELY
jgi:hypothetical protein